MTSEEFFELFGVSAFRLETLAAYGDPLDPALQAFVAGHPLPLPERPAKTQWLRLISQATAAGKTLTRVHVLSRPLSPYLKYELSTDPENVEAGEDVRIADRAEHPQLASLGQDFWLFDTETGSPSVLLMRYDGQGRFIGQQHTADPAVVAHCRGQRDLALSFAVPLTEFLAPAR